MASNQFGTHFSVTSFGESHGKHIGVVIDGCPSNIVIDEAHLQQELSRRRPGQSEVTTSRSEQDIFEITSGVFNGKTTGAPIAILIPNKDARSKDYSELEDIYRPSHADFTYKKKYGHRDFKGGGRSSARITAGWVAAGALAKQILATHFDIEISAYVSQIHSIKCPKSIDYSANAIEDSLVRCPDDTSSRKMIEAINAAKEEGDSLGGIVSCVIKNYPIGVGDPVFRKLNAQLAHGQFSINAVKGFQIGSGFSSIVQKGSELNDEWTYDDGNYTTKTNNSGGIQGGISNGMPITFDTAFKPTSTISKEQTTTNNQGDLVDLKMQGRHDPCVVPRAVPIVEAMAALTLIDFLIHRCP
ncbi:MAG: chorismate synthase [Bacteroidetes bacterium]|jgi:chorismate synthase|nr:chorismate synthase [Bacteroidota bacterium]